MTNNNIELSIYHCINLSILLIIVTLYYLFDAITMFKDIFSNLIFIGTN